MPLIGEIRIFPYSFVPRGWLECAGQILPIQQNSALYSVIANIYGGDAAQRTFALPDLRNRLPIHPGKLPDDARTVEIGQQLGMAEVALTAGQIPPHRHPLQRKSTSGIAQKTNLATPHSDLGQLAVVYDGTSGAFDLVPHMSTNPPTTPLHAASIAPMGNGRPHENRQPHMLLAYAICIDGDFPVRP